MTKEIVELPDRKSGDVNEIRDKKIALAKNATAQSDLPQQLEYLIKNGQTGEFMNVLDSYINEKIRSALGSLIASLDKGAAGTTKAIACIDTNNDLGIINPANLASVLGERQITIKTFASPPLTIQRTANTADTLIRFVSGPGDGQKTVYFGLQAYESGGSIKYRLIVECGGDVRTLADNL